jgi:hypothetical protein
MKYRSIVCVIGLSMIGWMLSSSVSDAQVQTKSQSPPVAVPGGNQTTPATTVSNSTNVTGVHGTSHAEHAALEHLIDSIEPYRPAKELKGAAVLTGSNTMLELGKLWSERFKKFHPDVTFTRGVDGTEAAIKALAEDPTSIVGISRPPSSSPSIHSRSS